jgi:formate--tetrahydrofolate ligase
LESSVRDKVDVLVRRVYGGEGARWGERALRQAERYESLGWGGLPVCMANTHLSLSADPRLVGCPRDFMIPITELRLAAGAGFVYPLVGRVLTMPGLPRSPRALKVDLDESGQVVGLG